MLSEWGRVDGWAFVRRRKGSAVSMSITPNRVANAGIKLKTASCQRLK